MCWAHSGAVVRPQIRIDTDSAYGRAHQRIGGGRGARARRGGGRGGLPGRGRAGRIDPRPAAATSAIAVAALKPACRSTPMWTAFTTDPHLPAGAQLNRIATMLELASAQGAADPLGGIRGAGVPLARSVSTSEGTWVVSEDRRWNRCWCPAFPSTATGEDHAPPHPGPPGWRRRCRADRGATWCDMIIRTSTAARGFTFTRRRRIPRLKIESAEIGAQASPHRGRRCRSSASACAATPGRRAHVETLAAEGINIQMISTSEIKISVVIEEKYGELAVRALHKALVEEASPEA
jgi:aspartate kinase